MEPTQKKTAWIIASSLAAVALYYLAAKGWCLNYNAKSTVKLVLFLGLPIIYTLAVRRSSWHELLARVLPTRRQLPRLGLTCVLGVALIVVVNLLAEPLCRLFGVASVIAEIQDRTRMTRERIWPTLVYIPLVNAMAEEFFFRGFAGLDLIDAGKPRLALVYQAGLFALYHLAIFQSWFSPAILALSLGGLFISGLFLGLLVRRSQNIASAWLLHGLVNVAIISISLKFF